MPRKILVVDDEPDLVDTCQRLLSRSGDTSLVALTGPAAIALIDREHPDLVVTDLRLPGVDGLAVVRHARAHEPPIPAILMTAYDSETARSAARAAGVTVYLAKPFSNASFLEAVRDALDGRHPESGGALPR
jgi:CheY-like chemotaxis protein